MLLIIKYLDRIQNRRQQAFSRRKKSTVFLVDIAGRNW